MTLPSPQFLTQSSNDSSNYAATTEFVNNAIAGARTVLVMTASEKGQTTFTPSNSQTFNYESQNVYLNGIYLISGSDYTVTTKQISTTGSDGTISFTTVGSAIVLSDTTASSVEIGAELALESYTSLAQSNSTSYLGISGGEITGSLTVDSTLTANSDIILNNSSSSYIQFQTGGTGNWNIIKDSSGNLTFQAVGTTNTSAMSIMPTSSTSNTSGTVSFTYTPTYSKSIPYTDNSGTLANTQYVRTNFISSNPLIQSVTQWTPELNNSGYDSTSTTQTVYTQTASGLYQNVGNIIMGFFSITLSELASYTGNIYISLPTTPDTTVIPNSGSGYVTSYSNLNSSLTDPLITINIIDSYGYLMINGRNMTSSDITSTSSISGNITYLGVMSSS